MVKELKLSKEQMSILKDILGEERNFLDRFVDRIDVGFYNEVEGLSQKVKESNSFNSSLLYDLCNYEVTSLHEDYYNYLKSIVEVHYKMQRSFVEKLKNQVWWSEGRPKDATSESLEEGVPEEYLEKRDKLKELLESLQ